MLLQIDSMTCTAPIDPERADTLACGRDTEVIVVEPQGYRHSLCADHAFDLTAASTLELTFEAVPR